MCHSLRVRARVCLEKYGCGCGLVSVDARPTSAPLPGLSDPPPCTRLGAVRPPARGSPAPSARVNFSQIPEPLRAKPPPRPNPRPPRICIIGLAAALPPAPAAAAAARDSLAVT